MHLSRTLGVCAGVFASKPGRGFWIWPLGGGGLWGVEDCSWSGM